MQQETLNYREAGTAPPYHAVWPLVVSGLAVCLFFVSLVCCVATWNTPYRSALVPGGDAAMGLRSHAGWIEWVEYTPWDNREYVSWSVPWSAPLFLALLPVVSLLTLRLRRRRLHNPPMQRTGAAV